MKLALVTTPWDDPSSVAAATREVVRHLADTEQIDVFVERGREGGDYFGWTTRTANALVPKEYDQVLYAVGNEPNCGFMAPLVRRLGGCVILHDWSLARLAWAAYPELPAGGLRGVVRALREGGPADARRYWTLRAAGATASAQELAELLLNRSLVRFGDCFLVPDANVERAVLDDRNARTPIRVVDHRGATTSADWAALAASYREALERFPAPRTARKSLLSVRVREGVRAEAEKRRAGS